MSRLNKVKDIIELSIMFQNSYCGISIEDIQEHFECSRRSAERMKSVLFEQFPDKIEVVENYTDRKKRWRFKKGSMNFLVNFTSNDFMNLEYLKDSVKNSTQRKEVEELIEKIKAINPKIIHLTDIEELLETQGFAIRHQFNEKIKPEVLEIVRESILSQKQILISYKEHKEKDIVLNPYGILVSDKQYLVCFNVHYEKIYLYRLSKINEIELLDSYFDKDENFNLKDFAKNSFGVYQDKKLNVKLEFKDSAKENAKEYYFHPTQKFKELENGNLEVTFQASGTFEIITELLKWRDSVKIISPKELKDEYCETIKAMFKNIQ